MGQEFNNLERTFLLKVYIKRIYSNHVTCPSLLHTQTIFTCVSVCQYMLFSVSTSTLFWKYVQVQVTLHTWGEVHGPGYPAPLRPDIYYPPAWVEGAQPCKEGVRGAATRLIFFGRFLWIFGNKFLVFTDRIHGNRECQFKSGRRDKIDVCKYICPILIGLGSVWTNYKQDRAFRPGNYNQVWLNKSFLECHPSSHCASVSPLQVNYDYHKTTLNHIVPYGW